MKCNYCGKELKDNSVEGGFCSASCKNKYSIGDTPRSRDEIIKRSADLLNGLKEEKIMAKVIKINVECSYLKSLPNYENIRFTAGAEVEIGPDDNLDRAYKEGWNIVGDEIEKQLALFEKADTSKSKKGL